MTDRSHDRALASWGNSLRAVRAREKRQRRWVLALGILVGALTVSIIFPTRPLLVWNVSESAPIGLYAIGARDQIVKGDMALARMPERWRLFAARRRYIPANVSLVKRVAAEPGDTVCALGQEIFVNGHWIAARRETDGHGRPMPWWTGCVTLRDGALFLLMDSPDSFDGRYFGSTSRADIIGEARLLWAR
jgi:conjugative transfer signal peptidase TraF